MARIPIAGSTTEPSRSALLTSPPRSWTLLLGTTEYIAPTSIPKGRPFLARSFGTTR